MTVHPTAIVSPKAQLGRGVSVGAFSVIYDNARIGDHTIIGAYCEIAHPAHNPDDRGTLAIGKRSIIRSRSTFYEGSEFGDCLVTGHAVTVRERTRAGEGLQIGTLGDIQGHCVIGNHVRFHSNVHIGHHSSVGDRVWIFPYVVLTNDPHPPSEVRQGVTVHEFAAIATMSVVLPGVVIGRGALIGAHSSVTKDVPPDSVAVGVPAKVVCRTEDVKRRDGSDKPAYPWRRHFHRGYPDALVDSWKLEFPGG